MQCLVSAMEASVTIYEPHHQFLRPELSNCHVSCATLQTFVERWEDSGFPPVRKFLKGEQISESYTVRDGKGFQKPLSSIPSLYRCGKETRSGQQGVQGSPGIASSRSPDREATKPSRKPRPLAPHTVSCPGHTASFHLVASPEVTGTGGNRLTLPPT